MLLFDIVIPTYNNLDEVKKCLHCFEKQTITSFHVWVCVDGSTDGTIEFLLQADFGFPVSVLQHADKKNHGRSAARNLSLPHLSAKYVLFLDSDFTFKHDFLAQHFSTLSAGDRRISLGSIRYDSGNIWRDYDVTRGLHQYNHDAKVPCKYLVTANMAMPVKLFINLNGFDENISSYGGEDTDLGCSIGEKYPHTIIFNRNATVYGQLNKSLHFALQQRQAFARTNLKYLVKKHPDAKTLFRVDILQSLRGRLLYSLILRGILFYLANSKALPSQLRIRIVHLLVFYHTYKGFHKE